MFFYKKTVSKTYETGPGKDKEKSMEAPFVIKAHKKLRCGYTTGTCAAAAARAAAKMLLGEEDLQEVCVTTPSGCRACFAVEHVQKEGESVRCAVKKDSGDDPDVTDGVYIFANVCKTDGSVFSVDGGTGVGRVTQKGLSCPVGSAAINPVPRAMIEKEVRDVCGSYGYGGGIAVEIYVPDGEKIARRTFNGRLGIRGGISILGTSGLVEPMSEQALVDSIFLEMDMMNARGAKTIALTPGNYGEAFLTGYAHIPDEKILKCSNFIGEALDHALDTGVREILLAGHIGKMVKLAGGIMNTHSKYADCRMEILSAYAALCGAKRETLEELIGCITVDAAIEILLKEKLLTATLERVMERIEFHIAARLEHSVRFGVLVFSDRYGLLGKTADADVLAQNLQAGGKD